MTRLIHTWTWGFLLVLTLLPSPADAQQLRLLGKKILLESPAAGVRVNGAAFYTRAQGADMILRYAEQTKSDKSDVAYRRTSNDNGRTWSDPVVETTNRSVARGTQRRGRYPGFVDPQRDILLVMVLQGLLPTDNPLEGMKHWTLRYSLSRDGGVTEYFDGAAVHRGNGYSEQHPWPGVWTGKNAAMIGDMTCRPIRIRTGEILQPVQITPIGPDGEYHNPGGGYTYHDSAVLIGSWNVSETLDWEISARVEADPNRSTRGMIEPTICEFPDGRILMVMRGSNDRKPQLPGYRWVAVSSDQGRNWSQPRPWTFEDGTRFFSPSSCSQLLQHSSGRIYWIGNISPVNPRGNHPRYPLVIGEVDRKTLRLRQETLCTIDDRRPEDRERMQISNFFAQEDRETDEIRVIVSPLFRNPPPPNTTGHPPPLDWTADLWVYRVVVEGGR
ncbi:MAG: sialidase family protein [Pirellulales bacterium]